MLTVESWTVSCNIYKKLAFWIRWSNTESTLPCYIISCATPFKKDISSVFLIPPTFIHIHNIDSPTKNQLLFLWKLLSFVCYNLLLPSFVNCLHPICISVNSRSILRKPGSNTPDVNLEINRNKNIFTDKD